MSLLNRVLQQTQVAQGQLFQPNKGNRIEYPEQKWCQENFEKLIKKASDPILTLSCKMLKNGRVFTMQIFGVCLSIFQHHVNNPAGLFSPG